MFPPLVLRRDSSIDTSLVLPPHMFETLDDPVPLQLCTSRTVAESGRTLRTVEEEQVRKPGGRHAEVCPGSFFPLRFERLPVDPFDVDLSETTGDGVEAGCQDEDIEFVEARSGLDAFGGDFKDGVFFNVDEIYVGLIVDVVVSLLQAWAFRPKSVWSLFWCFV